MTKRSDSAKKLIGDFSPKLVELTDRVLFDDVWERKFPNSNLRSAQCCVPLSRLRKRQTATRGLSRVSARRSLLSLCAGEFIPTKK